MPGPTLSNATSEALVAISKMLVARNMNMSIWWSAAFVRENMNALRTLFPKMPRLNSLFFPGGDGGELSWADIIAASRTLRQGGHPGSSVWVSAQEVGAQTLKHVFVQLKSNATVRDALGPNGGAVYGPHNRVTLVDFVEMLSAQDGPNSGSSSKCPPVPRSCPLSECAVSRFGMGCPLGNGIWPAGSKPATCILCPSIA